MKQGVKMCQGPKVEILTALFAASLRCSNDPPNLEAAVPANVVESYSLCLACFDQH